MARLTTPPRVGIRDPGRRATTWSTAPTATKATYPRAVTARQSMSALHDEPADGQPDGQRHGAAEVARQGRVEQSADRRMCGRVDAARGLERQRGQLPQDGPPAGNQPGRHTERM